MGNNVFVRNTKGADLIFCRDQPRNLATPKTAFLAILDMFISRLIVLAGVCSCVKYESADHDYNAHQLEGKEGLIQQ